MITCVGTIDEDGKPVFTISDAENNPIVVSSGDITALEQNEVNMVASIIQAAINTTLEQVQ